MKNLVPRPVFLFLCLILLGALLACNEEASPVLLPTPADPQAVQTAIIKTQNAPPPGFETIAFNPIDYQRESLPRAYFEVTINFTGSYTATGQEATSSVLMQVWEDNLQRARRVKLQFIGEAMASPQTTNLEAVRFGNDFYLLDSNFICAKNNQAAQTIATLTAGQLVGGFTLALPTGVIGQVNGLPAYQYGFDKRDVVLNVFRETPSAIEISGGEAWLWADPGLLGRFGLSMTVHNAKILFGEQAVTGNLRYEYNLLSLDPPESIVLPNGC
jgi:hypothetical protein